MTLEEWEYCTYVMQTEMRIFENICGSTAVKQAQSISIANRKKYQAKAEADELPY